MECRRSLFYAFFTFRTEVFLTFPSESIVLSLKMLPKKLNWKWQNWPVSEKITKLSATSKNSKKIVQQFLKRSNLTKILGQRIPADFAKQLRFEPKVWKTCLQLLMKLQSRNMVSLLGWSFLIFLYVAMVQLKQTWNIVNNINWCFFDFLSALLHMLFWLG
jgi:hypothetical protein